MTELVLGSWGSFFLSDYVDRMLRCLLVYDLLFRAVVPMRGTELLQ